MDELNHGLPDVTLQWRRLGEAGIMLVQSGEYTALTQVPRSRLRNRPARQVAKELNDTFLNDYTRTEVPLNAVKFLGNATGSYVYVGFSVDPATLTNESDAIKAKLDTMNRAPGDWRFDFQPFISLATLNRLAADEHVLNAFQTIMPDSVALHKPLAHVG